MSGFEVNEPILNSPFEEPSLHWWIQEGEVPEKRLGRRPAMYYYLEPGRDQNERRGFYIELKLVNLIRERVKAWRGEGWPGATRTTLDLLKHWSREGRRQPLFFAQREAAETVIFLVEARADFRQGIAIPRDEPSEEQRQGGYGGFLRHACKMATGSGKTTVMGMLGAWSILNKIHNRTDGRFSDTVLVICPNVTIRDRLRELDPALDEASLYRTRDLVPENHMATLRQGTVLVTNWHVLEPQLPASAKEGGKVVKAGVPVRTTETIRIGDKNETKRGTRWLTRATLHRQVAHGLLEVLDEGDIEQDAVLKVRSLKYVESDAALVNRVLRQAKGKKNLLVFNDEAHHAYRIKVERPDDWEDMDESERDDWLSDKNEATVWIEGLDRIHRQRGINLCVDLSATPYYLSRVGQDANRPFPWVISEFGLIDAIESGLVKIPQLAVRDNTGSEIPGYFNIWDWILKPGRLTAAERGGKRSSPKPEAILKWAHHPIAMLGGLWEGTWRSWQAEEDESRPPVYILVCKNTALANVIYEWLGNGVCPAGIPPAKLDFFRNSEDRQNTVVVHSKVVAETDSGAAKSDESRWMRFTLDTVGKKSWPRDHSGNELMPTGFRELADKLKRPTHPPGRDVRCIVSVGMLTEGWDCSTVTHIVGLRPFMSQLLCEQVVGRGLRRRSYQVDGEGRLPEEVAKVFGVPFQIIPFKANPTGPVTNPVKRRHVKALPERELYEIRFPRVEGYSQVLKMRVTVDWDQIPHVALSPTVIPTEVQVKGLHLTNTGRQSLMGPGRLDDVGLQGFRGSRRIQELVFDVAAHMTQLFQSRDSCELPAHVLFPQLARLVERYVATKTEVGPGADRKDLFLAPYYGWLVETLLEHLQDESQDGSTRQVVLLERSRECGTTKDVDFWTSKDVREVQKSHVNFVVADTKSWEQSAAFHLDTSPYVRCFVKNAGLGLGIPYLHNGEQHEYVPDFLIRLEVDPERLVILETKGYDPHEEVKRAAALRWCRAVNGHGGFGHWTYRVVHHPGDIGGVLKEVCALSVEPPTLDD